MRSWWKAAVGLLVGLALAGCASSDGEKLQASGVVEAVEVTVAPEVGGQVEQVLVEEGDAVALGQPLFRLANDVLRAQRDQANLAVEAAQGGVTAAEAGQETARAALSTAEAAVQSAEIQVHMALSLARSLQAPVRTQAWSTLPPGEFDLPNWYFQQSELIEAAQSEVAAAEAALQQEQQNLASVTAQVSGGDLSAAQTRLMGAQAAFTVIDQLRDRQIAGTDRQYVRDYIDELYDSAKSELDDAQQAYDDLLSQADAVEVLDARGRVAVAQERLITAQTELDQLRTGEHSLEVQAAFAGLQQAQALRSQAEAGQSLAAAQLAVANSALHQAQAALALIDDQIEKLTVSAPTDGVVMTRLVESGELVQPGVPALTIGQLNDLRITVYLPEDQYGQIATGGPATVSVDSYPDVEFSATVLRIADQAEFTPRNVQTQEDRQSTVYAIVLSVQDSGGRLKPGMPADVVFGP